jgi:hypothetical protein
VLQQAAITGDPIAKRFWKHWQSTIIRLASKPLVGNESRFFLG